MENLPKLSVTELTTLIKNTLEQTFFGLTVEGEVSGFKVAPTGHIYLSLKDEESLINAAIWKSTAARLPFIPKNGDKVIVTGYLSVYPPRGSYQITITSLKKSGEGDIQALLEERKRKYREMGYFDADKKRPIPKNPKKVGVITSSSGAALQDILQITGRRAPDMDIIILPALVQGSEAALSIATRVEEANTFGLADVLIVGRGGGSIEDLLPFSEDCVIQAIYNSQIPVISAVGHEVDWAISDFVADLRAPTPSAAAELVCEKTSDKKDRLEELKLKLSERISSMISSERLVFEKTKSQVVSFRPQALISNMRMTLDSKVSLLQENITKHAAVSRSQLEVLNATITGLSPVSALERGFAIVTASDGSSIRNWDNVNINDTVGIILKSGRASAVITGKENDI